MCSVPHVRQPDLALRGHHVWPDAPSVGAARRSANDRPGVVTGRTLGHAGCGASVRPGSRAPSATLRTYEPAGGRRVTSRHIAIGHVKPIKPRGWLLLLNRHGAADPRSSGWTARQATAKKVSRHNQSISQSGCLLQWMLAIIRIRTIIEGNQPAIVVNQDICTGSPGRMSRMQGGCPSFLLPEVTARRLANRPRAGGSASRCKRMALLSHNSVP